MISTPLRIDYKRTIYSFNKRKSDNSEFEGATHINIKNSSYSDKSALWPSYSVETAVQIALFCNQSLHSMKSR